MGQRIPEPMEMGEHPRNRLFTESCFLSEMESSIGPPFLIILGLGDKLQRHLWSSNFDTSWPFPTEELTLGMRSSVTPYMP
ncbi:hypothetical protein BM86_03325, partial [Bacillus thuringiensis]|nr:hypothetical protein [Bacillus thuringiensis]